jgi:Ca2+-binding EF-hand superfamily protein
VNKDGNVDFSEFVDGVSRVVVSGSISRQDLENIFNAIDINKDRFLSVNEFGLFLKGA